MKVFMNLNYQLGIFGYIILKMKKNLLDKLKNYVIFQK